VEIYLHSFLISVLNVCDQLNASGAVDPGEVLLVPFEYEAG
jgi:hypothetical protein